MSNPSNLNNNWTFRDETGDYAIAVSFPFDAVSALHAEGKIADPYWERNEYDLRWIAERDWVATSTFALEETDVELLGRGSRRCG